MRVFVLALTIGALAACQPEQSMDTQAPAAAEEGSTPVVDMHTSQIALDWAGTYEGLLPCADCAGLHLKLTLDQDGSFELVSRRLVRGATASQSQGQFEWAPDGNSIVVATADGEQRFAVGEGRLLLLEPGQTTPAWGRAEAILPQSAPDGRSTRQDLSAVLEDHRWTLHQATDAVNQSLAGLFPDPARGFVFSFAESRVHVQGGCNGLRGAYRINAEDMLEVTGTMSTLMACAEPLMEADSALAALLAEPLEVVLVRGAEPTLALLTPARDALVLRGVLTHEARFGTPTRVFLEVADQTVECEGSVRSDGRCLQVRERTFDEQGLLVGEPSEWQPFAAEIEGYQHEDGIRTILRINRFQPPADGGEGPIHVLDMVVQSEVVPG